MEMHICVLILLHMCPHTAIYVFSYTYICLLILLHMCPHTPICVLIQLIRSAKRGEGDDEESEKEPDMLQQQLLERAGKYLTTDLRATAASRGSNRRRDLSVTAPGIY